RSRHREVAVGAPQPARRSPCVDGRHPVLPAPSPLRHVLRIRDFGLLLAGRFVAVLAAQMQWVAVGWYLYDLTGSALTLAFAGLAAFVPIALLTLPAGDLSDRIDRRWLLAAAHLFQAMAAALLLVLVAVKATHTAY